MSSSSSYTVTTTTAAYNTSLILRPTTPENIRTAQDQADVPAPAAEPAVVTQANRTREAASSMILYLVQNSNKIGLASGAANVLCGTGMMAAGTGMYFLPSLFGPLAGILPTVVTDGIGITGVATGAGTAGLGIAQIINSLGLRRSHEAEQFATLFQTFAREALRLNANIQAESNRLEGTLVSLRDQLAGMGTDIVEIRTDLEEVNKEIHKVLQAQGTNQLDMKTKLQSRIKLAETIQKEYREIQKNIRALSEQNPSSEGLTVEELKRRMALFSELIDSLSKNQENHCELEQTNTEIITTMNQTINITRACLVDVLKLHTTIRQRLTVLESENEKAVENTEESLESNRKIAADSGEQEATLEDSEEGSQKLRDAELTTESAVQGRLAGAAVTMMAGLAVAGPLGALTGLVTGFWATGRGQRIYGAVTEIRCVATDHMKSRIQHGRITYGYDISSSGYVTKPLSRGFASTVNLAGSFFRETPILDIPDTGSSTRGTIEIEIGPDLILLPFNFQNPLPIEHDELSKICNKILEKVKDGTIDKKTATQILNDLMHPLEDANQQGKTFVNECNKTVNLFLHRIAATETTVTSSSSSASTPEMPSEVEGFTVV